MTTYKFKVKGSYPDGTKAIIRGEIKADDNFPWDAFDKAVAECKKIAPDLIVERSKQGQVVLTGKPRY